MPLPWPPLLRRLLSGRPGSGAQSYSGEEASPSASLEAEVVFSRARKGQLLSPFIPTPTVFPSTLSSPGVTYSSAYRDRQATFLSRTGGACGKLKSNVSSNKGQSWPKVAKQIGKHGDPVLPNLLTQRKKPPFFILNVGALNDLKGPNSSPHCLCFHLLLHSSCCGHTGLFTVWEPRQIQTYLRTLALAIPPTQSIPHSEYKASVAGVQ